MDITGELVFIVRADLPVVLKKIDPQPDTVYGSINLNRNENVSLPFSYRTAQSHSHPYWLSAEEKEPYGELALMPQVRGLPEVYDILEFDYTLSLFGTNITFTEPIDYKWSERVEGELHRNLYFSPQITANPSRQVMLFTDNTAQTLELLLENQGAQTSKEVSLQLPPGWKSIPESLPVTLSGTGSQQLVSFQIVPAGEAEQGEIVVQINGKDARQKQQINYPHILPQVMFPKASLKIVPLNLHKKVKKVGYVTGSGDEIAENLRQVGYDVHEMSAADLSSRDLSEFETIIVGIRAYNTEEAMKNGNIILNEFVKKGGTVIVQYNTSRGLKAEEIGPYPFQLSRNRVTNETAEATLLKPNHPLFNQPNKITMDDFDGWVQERGLYFADEWDEKYEPLISWHDEGEEPQQGSILVAEYGEGHFIYTGISFFRQLPAGVPGAYRLFSNMIAYGR